jgi:hypothetical protein
VDAVALRHQKKILSLDTDALFFWVFRPTQDLKTRAIHAFARTPEHRRPYGILRSHVRPPEPVLGVCVRQSNDRQMVSNARTFNHDSA